MWFNDPDLFETTDERFASVECLDVMFCPTAVTAVSASSVTLRSKRWLCSREIIVIKTNFSILNNNTKLLRKTELGFNSFNPFGVQSIIDVEFLKLKNVSNHSSLSGKTYKCQILKCYHVAGVLYLLNVRTNFHTFSLMQLVLQASAQCVMRICAACKHLCIVSRSETELQDILEEDFLHGGDSCAKICYTERSRLLFESAKQLGETGRCLKRKEKRDFSSSLSF